jgi:formate hydrogenlyase subunit 4
MNAIIGLILSPLLFGVINRTKAFFAGRQGPPLLQVYYDVVKLFRKGAVYSKTTTWVFRAAPVVSLSALAVSACIVPLGGARACVAFTGDLLLFAYLLALSRFATVLGALDTGSAFEGMGASREVQFSALAEPALFLSLIALARATGHWSLSGIYAGINPGEWGAIGGGLILIIIALTIVFLAENSRIPFDDPNTHLELTMIHEVMVLDYSGPDFALIELAHTLKFWVLGSLIVGLAIPFRSGSYAVDTIIAVVGLFALAAVVGFIESIMARLRLIRIPEMLLGASLLAAMAIVIVFSAGGVI